MTVKTPTDASAPAEFSICRGGPVYELARVFGLPPGAAGLRRLGLFLGLVGWLPLAGLAFLDGVIHQGATIPFWPSVGTHVRFLLAIPLFFLAEALFDTRVADVLRRMLEIGLILPGERPRLAAAVRQAIKARNSWLLEAALAVLTGAFIWAGLRSDLPLDVSTWRATAAGDPTWAGWWYRLVSLPLFQFLFWRWCWRLAIWSHLLWRISRLDLQLIATHPDAAGGLAVLGVAHVDLAPFGFAGCAVLSSSYAEQILYAGVPPAAFAVSFTAAVAGTTLLLTAPLLFFLPKLIDAKQRALLEYGTLAAMYTRAFAAKWLPTDPPPEEPLLGTPDLQSLADLGSSFDLIRQMTIVPIAKSQILLIAASAALPFAPLVLVAFPLDQLIIDSMKKAAERSDIDRLVARPTSHSTSSPRPIVSASLDDSPTHHRPSGSSSLPAGRHALRPCARTAGSRRQSAAGTTRRAVRGRAFPRARSPTPAGWPAAPTDRSRRRGAPRTLPIAPPR